MVWIRVLCVLACLAFVPSAAEATITYVYDRLGRLTGVIDPAQGTVIFRFDAVGNITAVERYAASAVPSSPSPTTRAWSRPPTPTSPLGRQPSPARATPTPSSTPAARTTARASTTTGRGTTAPPASDSFLRTRSASRGATSTSTPTSAARRRTGVIHMGMAVAEDLLVPPRLMRRNGTVLQAAGASGMGQPMGTGAENVGVGANTPAVQGG